MRRRIFDRFPDHAVLGEEQEDVSGNPESRYVWVLGPLDGTTDFMPSMVPVRFRRDTISYKKTAAKIIVRTKPRLTKG